LDVGVSTVALAPATCPLCQAVSRPLWDGPRATAHCSGCGVVWSVPPTSFSRPEERWSDDYYAECYQPRGEALIRDFGAHLDWLAPHVSGERWLDVGCGGGYFAAAALQRGWQVTGLDVSEAAVRLAKAVAPEARLLQGTAEVLEPDERFDVISFWDCVLCIPDLGEALAAYLRHLRPGGAVVCKTPHRPPRLFHAARLLGFRPALRDTAAGVERSCWQFTPTSLAAAFRRLGAEPVAWRWAREVPNAQETIGFSLRSLAYHALVGVVRAAVGPHESFVMVARKPGGR
jgi:SAM-dependent methyltransferase